MLAGRTDAVVATNTAADDAEMIEMNREPAGRRMAAIAFFTGRLMIGWFAFVLHIIVASRAAAENRIVIHARERQPRCTAVAVFAEIGARDVIRRFGAGADPTGDRVTGTAVEGCTLKHGTDMAGFTIGRQMSSVEPKTRREMIEARIEARLSSTHDRPCECKQQQLGSKAPHCTTLTSSNDVVV